MVEGLWVPDATAPGIGSHETAEAGIVVTSKRVVEAGLRVALVARELVVLRTGVDIIDFLAVGREVGIITNGPRVRSVALDDGTRGPKRVGVIEKDIGTGIDSGNGRVARASLISFP